MCLRQRGADDGERTLPDDLWRGPVDHQRGGLDCDSVAAGVASQLHEVALDGGGAVLGDVDREVGDVCVGHGCDGTRADGLV